MKKNEFEQSITMTRLAHENQIALSRLHHEQTMEAMTLRHQHRIEEVRVMGEEVRQTVESHLASLQPIYDLLGGEGTLAILRHQTEQMVAMVTHLGEKAADVVSQKINADVESKREAFQHGVVKTILEEIERVYFKGRDDEGDAVESEAAFAEALAKQVKESFRNRFTEHDDDDFSES